MSSLNVQASGKSCLRVFLLHSEWAIPQAHEDRDGFCPGFLSFSGCPALALPPD